MRATRFSLGHWLLGAVAVGVGGGAAAAAFVDGGGEPGEAPKRPDVTIVAPKVVKSKYQKRAEQNMEACNGGCSLSKHAVPPFTTADYEAALASFADSEPGEENEGLDSLLFYRQRTLELLELYGNGPLSPEHLAYLRRELGRENALVWLRLREPGGEIRAAVGPTKVPLGHKQHLQPLVLANLQPLEFNGTVMRTGLYHLWSRY